MDERVLPEDRPMFLTAQEVADLFRRKRSTVQKWCREGKIESVEMPSGGGFLIARSVVEKIIGRELP